jgi:hypothetical protein
MKKILVKKASAKAREEEEDEDDSFMYSSIRMYGGGNGSNLEMLTDEQHMVFEEILDAILDNCTLMIDHLHNVFYGRSCDSELNAMTGANKEHQMGTILLVSGALNTFKDFLNCHRSEGWAVGNENFRVIVYELRRVATEYEKHLYHTCDRDQTAEELRLLSFRGDLNKLLEFLNSPAMSNKLMRYRAVPKPRTPLPKTPTSKSKRTATAMTPLGLSMEQVATPSRGRHLMRLFPENAPSPAVAVENASLAKGKATPGQKTKNSPKVQQITLPYEVASPAEEANKVTFGQARLYDEEEEMASRSDHDVSSSVSHVETGSEDDVLSSASHVERVEVRPGQVMWKKEIMEVTTFQELSDVLTAVGNTKELMCPFCNQTFNHLRAKKKHLKEKRCTMLKVTVNRIKNKPRLVSPQQLEEDQEPHPQPLNTAFLEGHDDDEGENR